jgi:hypothetical protein
VKAAPTFTTYDEWLAWILDRLRKRAWQAEDTAAYVQELFTTYKAKVTKPPFAEFLADRMEPLPPELALRLGAYVLADPDVMAEREKRANKSLISRLARTKVPDETHLRFERGRTYRLEELGDLTDLAKQQVLATAANDIGTKFRNLDAFRKYFTEGDYIEPTVTYWQVLDGRQPVYELWTLDENDGTVFLLGTAKFVSVLRQGEFAEKTGGKASKPAATADGATDAPDDGTPAKPAKDTKDAKASKGAKGAKDAKGKSKDTKAKGKGKGKDGKPAKPAPEPPPLAITLQRLSPFRRTLRKRR